MERIDGLHGVNEITELDRYFAPQDPEPELFVWRNLSVQDGAVGTIMHGGER